MSGMGLLHVTIRKRIAGVKRGGVVRGADGD